MSVKIGHASIDENGKIASGKAGDQSRKEVCTRTWYNKKWDYVLRPKTSSLAEGSAKAMERACANDKIGYDQYQRNNLYKQAKIVNYDLSKITIPCECDCSSLIHVCAICGGANVKYGSNGATTRTLDIVLKNDYDKLTHSKYLTSDKHLKRGDVLVREGYHTVMILEDGSAVKKVIRLTADGVWGVNTTKRAQQVFGTTVDGLVSNQKLKYKKSNPGLLDTTFEWESKPGSNGSSLIKAIQKKVGVTADGFIGPKTIKAMQKWLGTVQDGCVSNPSSMVKAFQKWLNKQK